MGTSLSIIIPVYNAEKTLEQCISSILTQTYEEFELILINDGSKDNSTYLCNKLAKMDPRVKVKHQENQGVAAARNTGIAMAAGDYLQFVDSDDYLHKEMCQRLIDGFETKNCEWMVSSYYDVFENEVKTSKNSYQGIYTKKEYLKLMMGDPKDYYFGVLWNKLYLRKIIISNHLRFSNEVSLGEDFIFNLQYCCHVKRIVIIDKPLYYYVQISNSSLDRKKKDVMTRIHNRTKLFQYYKNFCIALGMYEANKNKVDEYILEFAVNEYLAILTMEKELPLKDRVRNIPTIHKKCLVQFQLCEISNFCYVIRKLLRRIFKAS